MLRSRLQTAPDAAEELQAAIEQIEALWEELQAQSEALAGVRQRHADFFEFAPDAYLITEAHAGIREANRCARELLRLRAEAVEGASLASFVPEADRPAFRARLVMLRGQPEGEMETWAGTLALADQAVPVHFSARPIKVRRKNADGLCWLIRARP